jgi:hypothetical protein
MPHRSIRSADAVTIGELLEAKGKQGVKVRLRRDLDTPAMAQILRTQSQHGKKGSFEGAKR